MVCWYFGIGMAEKTNTGLTMESDVLEGLDNEILQLKAAGKVPDDRVRSLVITEIVRDWLAMEDKKTWAEDHGLPPTQDGDTGNSFAAMAD